MWSQIDTYMNGKLVSLNTSYYPWKAYLKLLLSNGNDIATSQLQSQLFYLDDDDLEDVDPEAGSNGGLAQRYQFTKESNIFDMEGPLYEDIFLMDKYLVNGVDIHLKLFRNRASFCIVSDETTPSYKLEIVDVAFKACMIKVDSGVLINHAEILKKTTAKYPLRRTEVKMNTCPSGSGSFIWQNIWSNHLPTKAFFAFVKQTAVNGDYSKNPFNLLNLADEIALYVNGESIPARPMKMDVGVNKNYVTPFVNLFEAAEKWNKDAGLQIKRNMFDQGYAIYAFNLAPSDLGEEYINLVQQGSVRLEVKFAANTTETLNCIAYAEFPALIEVDHSREVRYTRAWIQINFFVPFEKTDVFHRWLTRCTRQIHYLSLWTHILRLLYVIQIPGIFQESIGLCFGFKILIIRNATTVWDNCQVPIICISIPFYRGIP